MFKHVLDNLESSHTHIQTFQKESDSSKPPRTPNTILKFYQPRLKHFEFPKMVLKRKRKPRA